MIVEMPVEVMDIIMKHLTRSIDTSGYELQMARNPSDISLKELRKAAREARTKYDYVKNRDHAAVFNTNFAFQSKGGWAAKSEYRQTCPSDIINLAMTCGAISNPYPFGSINMGRGLEAMTLQLHGIPWRIQSILTREDRWNEIDEFLKVWIRLECPFRIKIYFPRLEVKRTVNRVSIWLDLEELRLLRVLGGIPESTFDYRRYAGLLKHDKGNLKIEDYLLPEYAYLLTKDNPILPAISAEDEPQD
ncbi:hypothetical protein KVT40_007871 [Elsinoe batatas]|uniref:Uncharacterized protein n=1 Tax=Elsinoe batatas TaxID=2601811 RepID=A0A8K0KXW5_9PEZI|nr:hypothetical protein KVT40_007871 [Elsinoe batatas]